MKIDSDYIISNTGITKGITKGFSMSASKLTSKFQATIPKEIREKLKLKKGDSIVFQIINKNIIVVRKSSPFDKEYLKAVSKTLSEWDSSYDEADYEHLQDI